MTSAFSWQNSISLCPASFRIPRPDLPVTPGVSWLPTFAFHSPLIKRTSFWGVSSKRSVGLHWTVQFQLLQHYWLGHRLGLLWLNGLPWKRTEIILSFCIQVLPFGLVCWLKVSEADVKSQNLLKRGRIHTHRWEVFLYGWYPMFSEAQASAWIGQQRAALWQGGSFL